MRTKPVDQEIGSANWYGLIHKPPPLSLQVHVPFKESCNRGKSYVTWLASLTRASANFVKGRAYPT